MFNASVKFHFVIELCSMEIKLQHSDIKRSTCLINSISVYTWLANNFFYQWFWLTIFSQLRYHKNNKYYLDVLIIHPLGTEITWSFLKCNFCVHLVLIASRAWRIFVHKKMWYWCRDVANYLYTNLSKCSQLRAICNHSRFATFSPHCCVFPTQLRGGLQNILSCFC
jgi:hypothetical protein